MIGPELTPPTPLVRVFTSAGEIDLLAAESYPDEFMVEWVATGVVGHVSPTPTGWTLAVSVPSVRSIGVVKRVGDVYIPTGPQAQPHASCPSLAHALGVLMSRYA